MKVKSPLSVWFGVCLSASLAQSAFGQILITYNEDPADFNSSLKETSLYDFEKLEPGATAKDVAWEGVGTFNQLDVLGKGGPDESNYITLGGKNVNEMTLTFETPRSYFGFWWSAGEKGQTVTFYSGKEAVGVFSSETLIKGLEQDPVYKETGKAAAFVNFFGGEKVSWDQLVFGNKGPGVFDADMFTDRKDPWGALEGEKGANPGIVLTTIAVPPTIPEPSVCFLAVVGALLGMRRKR